MKKKLPKNSPLNLIKPEGYFNLDAIYLLYDLSKLKSKEEKLKKIDSVISMNHYLGVIESIEFSRKKNATKIK